MMPNLEKLFFLYSNRGQRRREVRALLAAVEFPAVVKFYCRISDGDGDTIVRIIIALSVMCVALTRQIPSCTPLVRANSPTWPVM
jgi:hypothetical protein